MSLDVWTSLLTSSPSLRNKSLRALNKVAHVELLRGLCRDMLWLWPAGTDNAGHKKDFLSSEKKEQRLSAAASGWLWVQISINNYKLRLSTCWALSNSMSLRQSEKLFLLVNWVVTNGVRLKFRKSAWSTAWLHLLGSLYLLSTPV